MNKLVLCLLALSLLAPTRSLAQDYTFLSYNIRYDNSGDGENQWKLRKESVVALIERHAPDIFGIQEGLHNQVAFLDEQLEDFKFIGVGRDDGKTKGEYSALFYNKNRLKVTLQGTFWLSPTPDKISVGWDAALERICTYAQFEDLKNNKKFWVFNTHYDHRGEVARSMSSKLIVEKIKELTNPNEPLILMGDFNSLPDSKAITTLLGHLDDGAAGIAIGQYGSVGTFNGFQTDASLEDRIDYIFIKNSNVSKYSHIADKRDNGLWVSDHLPILIKVRF